MEFELIRYVFFLLALTSTAALAQNIQLSPSQQQMLNQLPPAQRQMALEALKNQSGRTPIRTVHESKRIDANKNRITLSIRNSSTRSP